MIFVYWKLNQFRKIISYIILLFKEKGENKIIGFTTKDKGSIYVKYEDGSFSDTGFKAMSNKSIRKLQLISIGYTDEEAINIIKSEERERKINDILK